MASATNVCGTSTAIASGAASGCKKTDLAMTISISIIFTILMIVFEPLIIKATGMSALMGGALIGGMVDSTGAVTVAGSVLGSEGEQAAVLVKMIQNILIGFIAFFVASSSPRTSTGRKVRKWRITGISVLQRTQLTASRLRMLIPSFSGGINFRMLLID